MHPLCLIFVLNTSAIRERDTLSHTHTLTLKHTHSFSSMFESAVHEKKISPENLLVVQPICEIVFVHFIFQLNNNFLNANAPNNR